jgi:RHS repeat-associated protein
MGMSAADPDDLKVFVDRAAAARQALSEAVTAARATHDHVVPKLGEYGLIHTDLWVQFDRYVHNAEQQERFVEGVREAFLAADAATVTSSSGRLVVDDRAIGGYLGVVGLTAPPIDVLTAEAPQLWGRPPDSGFASDPVCTANGNFVHSELDLEMPGRAGAIRWQRTYNSRASHRSGAFGRGWSSWADTALLLDGDAVCWRGPDGAECTVTRPSEGGSVELPLLEATLHATSEGFLLERRGGETWNYDLAGRPTLVRGDRAEANLEWDEDRLIRLRHPRSGRSVVLDWEPGLGRITSVRASDGRRIVYRYDDAGDLVEVTGDPARPRTYQVEDGLIVAVIDADGVQLVRNGYDRAGRVLTQSSPHDRLVRFSYEPEHRTLITDEAGAVNAYQHDAAGRLVAVADDQGRSFVRTFDAAGRLVGYRERSGAAWTLEHDGEGNLTCRVGPEGVEERWQWDTGQRPVAYTDRNGATTSWSYRGDLRTPVEIRDPAGAVTRVAVNDDDLPTRIVDPDGIVTRLTWTADGQLAKLRDGEGGEVRLRYDQAGRLVETVDAAGRQTTWESDDIGRVLVEHAPGGRVSRFGYTPAGRPDSYLDPAGGRWRSSYGAHGRVSEVTDPLGATVAFDYDELGNTISITAPDGQKYRFGYDGLNRLVAATDPAGATTLRTHDADGHLISETDTDGNDWRRERDALGRVVAIAAPDGRTWHRRYDPMGNLVGETDPADATTLYERDACGRLVASVDPEGNRTTLAWTAAGRLASISSPIGHTTSYRYDRAGRLVEVRRPSGAYVRYERDPGGRVVSAVSSSGRTARWQYDPSGAVAAHVGPDGRAISYERNALGLPTRMTLDDGASYAYEYDGRGSLVRVIDPLGATSHYSYDQRGRLTSWTDPLGGTHSSAYDEVGRLLSATDPLGRTTSLTRDGNGHVVARRYADGTGQRWWRDATGRLTGAGALTDDAPRVIFHYDAAGRLAAAREPGRDVALTYDRAGHLTARETSAGRLAWRYDHDGRCLEVAHDGQSAITYSHDHDGWLTQVGHPTLGTIEVARDDDGRTTERDRVLERDADGRVTRIVHRGQTATFTYDAVGQLRTAEGPWGMQRLSWDLGGRRVAEEGPTGTVRSTYDAAGQLVEMLRPDGGRVRYAYDAAGRRTHEHSDDGASISYSWDALGRLASVARSTGATEDGHVRLLTDALGAPQAINDVPILWDPVSWPGHIRGLADSTVVQAAGHVGVASASGGGWLETDWQGSVGQHDPWGVPVGEPAHAHLGFRGELTVAGLVWQRARLLDPATRSFLTPDPLPHLPGLPAAASPYHYAWNDPVGMVDPTGLRPLSDAEYDAYRQQSRKGIFEKAWDAIEEDPFGALAAAGVIAAGVGLMFVPGGQVIGVGILMGAGVTAGVGLVTGSFNPRAVAIAGIAGGVSAGVGAAAASSMSALGWGGSAIASRVLAESAENLVRQELTHPGHIDVGELVVSGATGGLSGTIGRYNRNSAASGLAATHSHQLGDLGAAEVQQIQRLVDEAGRPLEVVGSAARGMRRGLGSDLPLGKGPGTKSDIDYLVPPGSIRYYESTSLYKDLPDLDRIIPGVHNPFIGPAIRFEPFAKPYFVPGVE